MKTGRLQIVDEHVEKKLLVLPNKIKHLHRPVAQQAAVNCFVVRFGWELVVARSFWFHWVALPRREICEHRAKSREGLLMSLSFFF